MSIDTLKAALPDYAKDLKLNLSSVLTPPGVTAQQIWGSALASALVSRNATVIKAIAAEAAQHLSPEAQGAAKTAAAIMGMNNIYYRFTHLVSEKDYATMPARLRMNAIANPGVDQVDFELYSLAVSAINGCGMCMDSHEQVVAKKGVGKDVVQAVIRIAAVIHAVAATLDAEEKLAA
ncbi:carboxymuconolactone decarboxylase family protein [Inquilinus sp. CA228]|uniref:carboxymuconolactone decarboxylase family protein n=1 Tax=Inquilinus sp. CA228 TaxID=3455609 RepID=UPI003F8CF38E